MHLTNQVGVCPVEFLQVRVVVQSRNLVSLPTYGQESDEYFQKEKDQ